MARTVLGSLLDRHFRNELNRMLEELYDSVFLFSDGRNFIEGRHIADDAISARHYAPYSVGTSTLAGNAVTSAKIADNAISARHYAPYSVGSSTLATGSVSPRSIRNNGVPYEKIDRKVHYEKTKNEVKVFIPSAIDYVCYSLKRKTKAYEEGVKDSNIDLWSLDRVSAYKRDNDGNFTEDSARVFIYSNSNYAEPTKTLDTIFRRVGDTDYSGGNIHGDEKLTDFRLMVGNSIINDEVASGSARTIMFIQETNIYPDSFTVGPDTSPFMKMNKVHSFSTEDGYTLSQRAEALVDVNLQFSSMGSFGTRREHENGGGGNLTSVVGVDTAEWLPLGSSSAGLTFKGRNERTFHFIGWFKEIDVTWETDSDFSDTWVRNTTDVKLYTRVVEENGLMEQGKAINAKMNYKFSLTG